MGSPEDVVRVVLRNRVGALLQARKKGSEDVWLPKDSPAQNPHRFRRKVRTVQELLHEFPLSEEVVALEVRKTDEGWVSTGRQFFRK